MASYVVRDRTGKVKDASSDLKKYVGKTISDDKAKDITSSKKSGSSKSSGSSGGGNSSSSTPPKDTREAFQQEIRDRGIVNNRGEIIPSRLEEYQKLYNDIVRRPSEYEAYQRLGVLPPTVQSPKQPGESEESYQSRTRSSVQKSLEKARELEQSYVQAQAKTRPKTIVLGAPELTQDQAKQVSVLTSLYGRPTIQETEKSFIVKFQEQRTAKAPTSEVTSEGASTSRAPQLQSASPFTEDIRLPPAYYNRGPSVQPADTFKDYSYLLFQPDTASRIDVAPEPTFEQKSAGSFQEFKDSLNIARDTEDPGERARLLFQAGKSGAYALGSGVALGLYRVGEGIYYTATRPGDVIAGGLEYGANLVTKPGETISGTINKVGDSLYENPVATLTEGAVYVFGPKVIKSGFTKTSSLVAEARASSIFKVKPSELGAPFEQQNFILLTERGTQRSGVQLDLTGKPVPDATLQQLAPNIYGKKSPLGLPEEYYQRLANERNPSAFRLDDPGFQNINKNLGGELPGGTTSRYAPTTDTRLVNPDYVRVYDLKTGAEYDIKALDLAKDLKTNPDVRVLGRPQYGTVVPEAVTEATQKTFFDIVKEPIGKKGQARPLFQFETRIEPAKVSPNFRPFETQLKLVEETPSVATPSYSFNPANALRIGVLGGQPQTESPGVIGRSDIITEIAEKEKVRADAKLDTTPITRTYTFPKQVVEEEAVQKITPITRQASRSAQTSVFEQVTEQESKLVPVSAPPSLPRRTFTPFEPVEPKTSIIPKAPRPKDAPRSPFSRARGFVAVSKKGKIISPVLTKAGAEAYGKRVLDTSALQSFRTIEVNQAPQKINFGGADSKKFYVSKKGFITEKRKYAIDTPGEILDVTVKGIFSKASKKKYFGGTGKSPFVK